jgi:hypothetical protein
MQYRAWSEEPLVAGGSWMTGEESQALAGCGANMGEQIASESLKDGDDGLSLGRVAAVA